VKVLFLTHAFNSLAQRLHVELDRAGHEVAIEFDVNDAVTREAVELAKPDVIVAPYLKRAIPEDIWSRIPCLIVHPGPPGNRGPTSLDWAIQEGEKEWGVTVLQAVAEMDAGPVWAHAAFPMRPVAKGSLYRCEVTEAAVACVLEALGKMSRGERPQPLSALGAAARGTLRPPMKQRERAIDWTRDDTQAVLRKIHAADGFPGVRMELLWQDVHLFGAHDGKGDASLFSADGEKGCVPGEVIAQRGGAILIATLDGAVWVTHLKRVPKGNEPELKLPAAPLLGDLIATAPEAAIAIDAPDAGPTWREIRYEQHDEVGVLHFAFHNGAMSTAQCKRLLDAIRFAKSRPAKILMLAGGPDFWSNGIHLNAIEATGKTADASWENINAIDDVAREIVMTADRLTISALCGNAGAGGVFLALAADRVWLHNGVILNPHYKGMGNLYGSEYWTYLLPRRVGEARAREITSRRLPMSARGAVECGLADAHFGHAAPEFLRASIRRALAMARDPSWSVLLEAKRTQRAEDEAAKPLERYREEELEKLKLNFYGFDASYHVARYHFVYKLPKARTPGYLATHRGAVAAKPGNGESEVRLEGKRIQVEPS
jgi:putative two-component system hydrogenase maturation factor HypX/HoxX